MIYTAQTVKDHDVQRGPDWKPARPINYTCDSWRQRVLHAWGVLVGRYDALDWEEAAAPQPEHGESDE